MKPVVIAGFARSPQTFAKKGALTKVRPDELAAQVVSGLVAKTKVPMEGLEDLLVGCAFPEAEQGLNVARLIGFLAKTAAVDGGCNGQSFLRVLHAGDPHGGRRDTDGGG